MSRQLEVKIEERATRRRLALESALEYGLAGSIEATGLVFLGFTVRYDADDCLIVLKATTGDRQIVSFVGSDTLPNCILKCVRDAQNDRLRWRPDRFAKEQT